MIELFSGSRISHRIKNMQWIKLKDVSLDQKTTLFQSMLLVVSGKKGWEEEEAFRRTSRSHSRHVLSDSSSTDEDEPSGAGRATWLSKASRNTKRRSRSCESSDEAAYLASQSAVTPNRNALRAPPDTAMASLEWVQVWTPAPTQPAP